MYKLKMLKKLAKIKYLPNNFKIIENGDHVLCAVSGKKISLDFPSIMCPDPLIWIRFNHFF